MLRLGSIRVASRAAAGLGRACACAAGSPTAAGGVVETVSGSCWAEPAASTLSRRTPPAPGSTLVRGHLLSSTASASRESSTPVQRLFQTSQPRSLQTEQSYVQVEANDKSLIGRLVLKVGGYYSKESQLVRGSNSLLKMTLDHCEGSGVREALGLEDDFRTKHAFLCLHVWMVLRRLRNSGQDGKKVSQFFYDNFQHEVEMSVLREGVRVRVNKWLRQLEDIFFGAAKAYDGAIDQHAEDFADVLHRNLFRGEGDKGRSHALARYAIRELVSLSMTDTEAVLSGRVAFSSSTD